MPATGDGVLELDMSQDTSLLTKSDVLMILAEQLQPLPAILNRLAVVLGRGDCTLSAVADIIRMDPVLTLKLLRTANSAFCGGGGIEVSTVEDAVLRLGVSLVSSMTFALSVGDTMTTSIPAYGLEAGQLWRESVAAAIAAESLLRLGPRDVPPSIVTAALLHDVGKLLMAQGVSAEEMEFVFRARQQSGMSLQDAEMEVLEMNHAEVGFIVARRWGLPEEIGRAIMYHHTPDQCDDRSCDAVYIAALTAENLAEANFEGQPPCFLPLPQVVERLGLPKFDFEAFCNTCARRFSQLRTLYNA
jgi:putative nucleotidyltransferase with HDIG domain